MVIQYSLQNSMVGLIAIPPLAGIFSRLFKFSNIHFYSLKPSHALENHGSYLPSGDNVSIPKSFNLVIYFFTT